MKETGITLIAAACIVGVILFMQSKTDSTPQSPAQTLTPANTTMPVKNVPPPTFTSVPTARSPVPEQQPQVEQYNPPPIISEPDPPPHKTLDDYPEYDKNGRQLRAVCNSGTASYWQYDGVCLLQSGVYQSNPRWVPPGQRRVRNAPANAPMANNAMPPPSYYPPANIAPANRMRPPNVRTKGALCFDGFHERRLWTEAYLLCSGHGGIAQWED